MVNANGRCLSDGRLLVLITTGAYTRLLPHNVADDVSYFRICHKKPCGTVHDKC